MPLPDYQTLMLPVLAASTEGEMRIGQVVDRLADQLGLTADDRTKPLPSGKQTIFSNRVHWAKTYLISASARETAEFLSDRRRTVGKADDPLRCWLPRGRGFSD
jgi:restriction system protein